MPARVVDHTAPPFAGAAARGRAPVVDHTAPPFAGAAARGRAPVVDRTAPPFAGAAARGRAPVVDHTAPPFAGAAARGRAPVVDHVPMRAARTLAGTLHLSGLDVRALYAGVGLDLGQLFDRAVQIPYARWCALWRRAELEARDPLLGLRTTTGVDLSIFAAGIVPETDHLLVHLTAVSPTVGEALENLARYFAIGFGAATLALTTERGKLAIAYQAPSDDEPTGIADSIIGLVANFLRSFAARPVHPTIELRRRRAPADAYRKLAGIPVALDAGRDAVVIPARAAAIRMKSANPTVCARLVERAEHEIAARALPPAGFLAEVRTMIAMRVEQRGGDTVAAIADGLKTSRRTLARRLAAEGTTFQALLDEVRTAIAARHLANGTSIADVADRLGFADTSSFTRAFRRWTGRTPAATRRGTSRTP